MAVHLQPPSIVPRHVIKAEEVSCDDRFFCGLQEAKKQEEKAAREAGLEGKDAFAELKKLSRSDSLHHNDPREDLERLYRDANEGIPVAGRPATWEATRPTVLPAGEPVKHRGFIDYRRSTP